MDEKERDTEPVKEGHDCVPKHPQEEYPELGRQTIHLYACIQPGDHYCLSCLHLVIGRCVSNKYAVFPTSTPS